ncbi:3-oxoadipate enol-lactonase [Primorskyibacter sp. S187A]|uniref:3-oxoadipate enol-lactonase n=1 Tax=Primorskyibacter sp. S187A TaxID=3415130 RepID=UPI003C7C9BA9
MMIAELNNTRLHYKLEGPEDGAPVVFANSLGTDLRLWDAMLPHLPAGLRILRYDKRGHGLSDAPDAPYTMGQLVGDAEALIDHVGMKDVLFVGLSIGGLIAQGLAVKRLDLVRAMVLSNTGAKIGTRQMWADRIAAVASSGTSALAAGTMERWFSKEFRTTPELTAWQNMFERCPPQGWTGCAAAIAGTDFITPTSGLRLPCLGIAGSEDGSTPPDLVRETVDLIPGSRTELMRGAGHLPCVEQPEEYAALLTTFLRETGHI